MRLSLLIDFFVSSSSSSLVKHWIYILLIAGGNPWCVYHWGSPFALSRGLFHHSWFKIRELFQKKLRQKIRIIPTGFLVDKTFFCAFKKKKIFYGWISRVSGWFGIKRGERNYWQDIVELKRVSARFSVDSYLTKDCKNARHFQN